MKDSDDDRLGVILGTTIGTIAIVLAVSVMFGLWHFKFKPQCKKKK